MVKNNKKVKFNNLVWFIFFIIVVVYVIFLASKKDTIVKREAGNLNYKITIKNNAVQSPIVYKVKE